MSAVASKNTYELLGNDPELDEGRPAPPPTQAVDKPLNRSGKRNAGDEAPKSTRFVPGAGDQTLVSRPRQQDDGLRQDRHANRARANDAPRGSGRGRGGRGEGRGAGRAPRDDRQNKNGQHEHEKQVARSWGANTGEGELADELGGAKDAHKEENEEGIVADPTPVNEDGTPVDQLPAEPEDNTKTYEQYLAEQAEKRAALNDRPLAARQANEGSKTKFPEGKPLEKSSAEEDLVKAAERTAAKHRERKAKQMVEINNEWVEQPSPVGRGDGERRGGRGRGGFRGEGRGERPAGESRGDFQGGRGGRGEGRGGRGAGRGGPRGEFRGGEGRGSFRGEGRGGRGGRAPNVGDSQAFPSLGA